MLTIFPFLFATSFAIGGDVITPESFSKACAAASNVQLKPGQGIVGDAPNWLFPRSELAHLGTGRYWEGDWSTQSVAGEDPAPVIAAYARDLKEMGVEMIFVPVPPKASIYPEKFREAANESSPTRIAPFLELLEKAGVTCLDLETLFLAHKNEKPDDLLYCRQDSHPSALACQLIAKAIAQEIGAPSWVKSAAERASIDFGTGAKEELQFKGDLAKENEVGIERMPMVPAGKANGDGTVEIVMPGAEDSPVIVLGDSHALVFHSGGELLGKSGGVVDHLQAELGFPVYLEASRGSGIDTVRRNLMRKAHENQAFWNEKKVLIWLIGARELTQHSKWKEYKPRL